MKILYVGSDAGMSGAGLSMIKLAEELEKNGIDVVRVVRKGNTEQILSQKGTFHYIVNAQSWVVPLSAPVLKKNLYILIKKIINVRCYFQYCRIVKKEAPDIIHLNAITTYVAAKVALKYKKPIVWHIRELVEEDLAGEFWNKNAALKLLGKSTEMIAISDCVKNKYQKLLPDVHITRIYNGIDIKQYYCPEHAILSNKKIVFTMAGRINCNKGQYQCLNEMKDILKSNSDIVLQFAGTGDKDEIEKMKNLIRTEQIPSEQVLFLGYISDMKTIWETTDVTIVYSKCEAFGRVTVEAMVAGALVLGYDSGCTSELIQDGVNGFLFNNSNCSLYTMINKVLKNKEAIKKIAKTGQEQASALYTAENNARLVAEVYKSVAGRRDAE